MECPGCNRRFGPAAAEQWDACPICGTSWVASHPAPAMASGGASWATPPAPGGTPWAAPATGPAASPSPGPAAGPTVWRKLADAGAPPAGGTSWTEPAAPVATPQAPPEPASWSPPAPAEPTSWSRPDAPAPAEPTWWSPAAPAAPPSPPEPASWAAAPAAPLAPAEPTVWSRPAAPATPAEPTSWSPPAAAEGTVWLPTEPPAPGSWRARVSAGDASRPAARRASRGTFVVAPRARMGFSFYDFVLYDDAVQFVPIPGPPPEIVGAVVGWFTVSAYLGWYLGSLHANRANPQRLADLRRTRPTPRTVEGEASRPIRYDEVARARLQRTLFSTRLRLRYQDGNKGLVVWPNRQLAGVDLEGALAAGLGSTLTVQRAGLGRKVVDGLGVVLLAALALMITVGTIRNVFGLGSDGGQQEAAAPEARDAATAGRPGYPAARTACDGLARHERWMGVQQTTIAEDAAAVDTFAAGMAAAAQEDPVFAPAAAAGTELAMLIRSPEDYGSDYDQQVDARLAVINAACRQAG